MSKRIRELREKRGALADQAQLLIPATGQTLTEENRRKFDVLMSECESLGAEIRQIELQDERRDDDNDPASQMAALNRELRQSTRPPEDQIGEPDGSAYTRALDSQAERRYRSAFTNFLRQGLYPDARGFRGVSDAERAVLLSRGEFRDMGVGTGNLGGYFVPQGFVYNVEVAMKFYGEILQSSKILDTATGNPLPYPTSNDTSVSAELIGEGVQVTDTDVAIGQLLLGAYKYSTKMVKVSLELIQDSAFDINSYLAEQFAIRLARKLNHDFTLGTGASQPTGIVTAAVANNGAPQVWGAGSGPGIPLVAAGSSSNTGGAETGATSIGSDDLFNLEHSVDRLYRKGAAYMLNDSTLRLLKTIKDKYGRPLWLPALRDGAPDTLNGYPYFINNDMAAVATGNVTILFGDLRKYLIRRVKQMGVLRLVERFADFGQVAFIGFARYDGNLLDAGTHPVNYLKQA